VAKKQNTGALVLGLAAIYLLATSRRAAAVGDVPGGDNGGASGVACRPPQRIPIGQTPAGGCKPRTLLPLGYRSSPFQPGTAGAGYSGWSIPEEWYPGMLGTPVGNGATDPEPEDIQPEGNQVGCNPPGIAFPGDYPAPGCNLYPLNLFGAPPPDCFAWHSFGLVAS
jgi:hypothetical protein